MVVGLKLKIDSTTKTLRIVHKYEVFMIIQRWQAPHLPTEEQVKMILQLEGLDPSSEFWQAKTTIKEHRHSLTEILFVTEGELTVNVSGNTFLLRQGDRAEIPANTRHQYQISWPSGCQVLISYRV